MKRQTFQLLAVLGLLTGPVLTQTAAGSSSPLERHLPIDTCNLVLRSTSLRQVSIFNVDVYWVGLYLEMANAPAESVMCSNQVKAFVFHFLRDVKSDKLQESWMKDLSTSCPSDCRSVIEQGRALARRLPDIHSSQEIAYVLFPQRVEVLIDGEMLGTLVGRSATRAILATFLGPKAPSELRRDLLRTSAIPH